MYICIYVYMYIFKYLHIYIYIYKIYFLFNYIYYINKYIFYTSILLNQIIFSFFQYINYNLLFFKIIKYLKIKQLTMQNQQTCILHNNETITNFCKSSSCVMPLCPECINDHYFLHQKNQIEPQIEQIQMTYQNTNKIIRYIYKNLEQNLLNLQDFYQQRSNKQTIFDQIYQFRQQIQQILDSFFENLQQEQLKYEENERFQQEEQLKIIEYTINDVTSNLEKIQCKINEDKNSIKYLVKFLHSDYVEKTLNDSLKIKQILENLKDKQISEEKNKVNINNIQPILAQIFEILNKNCFHKKFKLIKTCYTKLIKINFKIVMIKKNKFKNKRKKYKRLFIINKDIILFIKIIITNL
ncbi:hypothetical protein IMG5_149450, partial [Ichthyophthirius multifiliis]